MLERKPLLVALAVLFPALALAAAPAPRTFDYRVGEAEVVAVEDADMEVPAKLFQNADPAVLAKLLPSGKAAASVNAFLVKAGGKNILVDAGFGAVGPGGHLLEALAAAGVDPGAIDAVVLTHAHSDHTGGLLTKEGAPAFAKARIFFAKAEVPTFDDAAMEKLPAQWQPYFQPTNAALKAYGDRVALLSPGDAVADGVTVVDLAGHTPGSIGLLVESGGKKLLLVGDILHAAAVQFARPDYCLVYDADAAAAVKARRALLTRVSDERLPIAAVHVPFPGIGTVKKAGEAFRFTPVAKGSKKK